MSLPLRPIDIEFNKNLEAIKNWGSEAEANRAIEKAKRDAKAAQREEDRRVLQRQINETRGGL